MSQLANALRHITKKASHPNALIYNVQLQRAKEKYLVQGQLEDGKEEAVALAGPGEKGQEQDLEHEVAGAKIDGEIGLEADESDGKRADKA